MEAGHTPAGAPLSAAESKEKSLDSNPDTAGSDAKAVNLGPSSSSPRAPSDGMAMERHGSKRGKHVPKKEGVAPDDEVLAGIGSKAGADGENGDGGNTSGERFYSDESCSVCLDEYEEGDQLLQLTCGHVFHRPCINLWLKGHCVCPCCRWVWDGLYIVCHPRTRRLGCRVDHLLHSGTSKWFMVLLPRTYKATFCLAHVSIASDYSSSITPIVMTRFVGKNTPFTAV